MNEFDLDRLLATARVNPPPPSPEFMARVLQEALAELPAPEAQAMPQAMPVVSRVSVAGAAASSSLPQKAAGLWARFCAGLGGNGVVAGLGAVALAGVWFGYADPAGLTDFDVIYADAGLELVPAAQLFMIEG